MVGAIHITAFLLSLPLATPIGKDVAVLNQCEHEDKFLNKGFFSNCVGLQALSRDYHVSGISVKKAVDYIVEQNQTATNALPKDELLISLKSLLMVEKELDSFIVFEDKIIFYLDGGLSIFTKYEGKWEQLNVAF